MTSAIAKDGYQGSQQFPVAALSCFRLLPAFFPKTMFIFTAFFPSSLFLPLFQ